MGGWVWTNEDNLLGRAKLRLLALKTNETAIHYHLASCLMKGKLAEVLANKAQVICLKVTRLLGAVPQRTGQAHVFCDVECQARIVVAK